MEPAPEPASVDAPVSADETELAPAPPAAGVPAAGAPAEAPPPGAAPMALARKASKVLPVAGALESYSSAKARPKRGENVTNLTAMTIPD